MRFFWSHHPDYWEGLGRRNLLRGEYGVRFVQSPWAEERSLFNRRAAVGTPLHRLIHETGCGLLVDRGSGGCPYRHYAFDRSLLDAYAARLDERFLGIQLHEWVGGIANDWKRIEKHGLEKMANASAGSDLFGEFESGGFGEYLGRTKPATAEAFMLEAVGHYERLSRLFGGYVNVVDSGVQSYLQGLRLGARHVMPELGNQTPMSRLQVAYVRGMARAAGRPWGVYYECWGGKPFGVTCFNGQTMWRIGAKANPYAAHGGAGGSSQALQRRILLFAWLAGAGSFAEEWGDSNTFHDWTRYELTPGGQVIADYLDLSETVKRGDPVTPVALVVDPSATPVEVAFLARWIDKRYRLYPPSRQDEELRTWLTALFWPADAPAVGHDPIRGNEWYNLTNTPWPDVFDMVPSDAPAAAFDRYEALLYLGDDEAGLRRRLGGYRGEWLSRAGGVESGLARMRGWLRARLPVWVEGGCQWTLNRAGGQWLLAVLNNEGIHRTTEGGETACEAASREVRMAFHPKAGEWAEIGVGAGGAGKAAPCVPEPGAVLTAVMRPGQIRLWRFRCPAGQ